MLTLFLAHSCMCDLVISNNKGGLWVLPLNLHALSACPDDIITIEAKGLNKEAHVAFNLSSPVTWVCMHMIIIFLCHYFLLINVHILDMLFHLLRTLSVGLTLKLQFLQWMVFWHHTIQREQYLLWHTNLLCMARNIMRNLLCRYIYTVIKYTLSKSFTHQVHIW